MNLFDPAFAPFTIALLVMLFMAILEVGSLAFGASLSGMLDDVFDGPDADMPDASPGLLDSFFGWLGVGRVPAMILLAALLLCFGVIGITAATPLAQHLQRLPAFAPRRHHRRPARPVPHPLDRPPRATLPPQGGE